MFTKLQLNKIILGLQKGYVPIKYSYITDNGANAWNVLEENRKTCSYGDSYDSALLLDTIELYISELNIKNQIILFDFGSGTGNTIIPTIKYLAKKGFRVSYHAFDISENITSLLKENFKKEKIDVDFDYTIIDFEEKDLSETIFNIRQKYKSLPILGLFLGNTIGNFTSIERVLSNIMDSLNLKDKLLIGIERVDLQNKRWLDNMLNGYRQKISHTHDFSTLEYLGFSKELGDFDVGFNKTNLSVEVYFVFKKDFQITIDKNVLEFKSLEKIKLLHSKKLNEEEFSKLLIGLDLRICNLRTSKDNLYLQVLVENKKIY